MPRVGVGAGLGLRKRKSAIGLDVDFRTGALPAGWSFSRTGAGTALNASGQLVAFASGQPRITSRGLLVEEARTNRTDGANFTTASSGGVTNQATMVAADAAPQVVKDALAAAGLSGVVTQLVRWQPPGSFVNGQANDDRLFFAGTVASLNPQTATIFGFVETGEAPDFTLSSGTTRIAGTTLLSGFQRTVLTQTPAVADRQIRLYAKGAATVWLALPQIEEALSPSAPIVTNGASATRAYDNAAIAVTIPASNSYTAIAEAEFTSTATQTQTLFQLGPDRVQIRRLAAGQLQLLLNTTNATKTVQTTATIGTGVVKAGYIRSGLTWTFVVNGAVIGTTDITVDTTTELRVGARISGGGAEVMNDYIRRIRILPVITVAQLQAATS